MRSIFVLREPRTLLSGSPDGWTPGAGRVNGRFVDARYPLSKWAWFVRLPRHRPSEGNNRLAASDADCSNAAFFSAQSVCSTVLVEPCLDPIEPRTQPIGRDADPNTHRKASFSLGDHEPGTSSHRHVPILFARRLAFAQHARKVQLSLATPARRSRSTGRFVDAMSLLLRWAWFVCLRDPGQRPRGVGC